MCDYGPIECQHSIKLSRNQQQSSSQYDSRAINNKEPFNLYDSCAINNKSCQSLRLLRNQQQTPCRMVNNNGK